MDDVTMPDGNTVLRARRRTARARHGAHHSDEAMVDFNFGVQMLDEYTEPLSGTLLSHEIGLAEVLVTPRSGFIGQTLAESGFYKRYGVQVLGVLRNNELAKRQRVKLQFGDSLLVRGTWDNIEQLANERRNFVVVGRPEAMAQQVVDISRDTLVAGGILVAMIALMVSGLVPTVIAAVMAAVAMVLFGCLNVEQAYRGISWSSVVLDRGHDSHEHRAAGDRRRRADREHAGEYAGRARPAGVDGGRLRADVGFQPGDQQHSHDGAGRAHCACPPRSVWGCRPIRS